MASILISGASIAGPTLAWWLVEQGHDVTIVERSRGPRPGGQAIDVRGRALEVIERMGLLDGLEALRTRMKGMSAVAADGSELWHTEEMTYSGGALDSGDVELLRDDLAALLLGPVADRIELAYSDSITALDEEADGITASFAKTPPRRFDLIVGADGIHSNVRRLAFGDEAPFIHPLGHGLAIFTTPNIIGLEDWQISYEAGDANCLIYTVRANRELRACFTFPATLADEQDGDVAAQKAMLREKVAGLGWEVPRFLAEMDAAPDFYFGTMAQIRMPHWTKGRVALVGDAGYCPSPFTGQGTSLAIVGAYVLAQEIGRAPADHATAFARYEARMRPFVAKNQAIVEVSTSVDLSDDVQRDHVLSVIAEAKNAILLDGTVI